MARTRRIGWKTVTGDNSITNWKTGEVKENDHRATNDWFSKKNTCRGSDDRGEYWGRDKKGVKQVTRRRSRRIFNNTISNEEFLYED